MVRERTRFDFQSIFRLTELADYSIAFTIRIIAELGIADHLAGGPCTVAELAEATATHAPSLHRSLRALACKGIFTEVEPGRFGLTPMAQLLRGDHPLSMRDGLPLVQADVEAWAAFEHCLRTGEPAFDYVHGQDFWDYLAAHPDENARFMRSQQPMTRLELLAVRRVYDWSGLDTVVDLGGGDGTFLAGILQGEPDLRGVLFDLPSVARLASEVLTAAGVADRCQIIAGSYLEGIPPGHSAYLLKRVLWGHDDRDVARILANLRRAVPDHGRVVVMEPLRREGDSYDVAKILDLKLLAMGGGGSRTEDAFQKLFARAGFRVERVVPAVLTCLIEINPA